MKYLKGTMIACAATLIFSISANAASLTLSKVTIPVLSGIYRSSERIKDDTTVQKINTIDAKDKISGDGRVIMARVQGMYAGMSTTAWIEATKGKTVNFSSSSKEVGSWKLNLKSKKSLPTQANYWGTWTYQ